jgi:hypothetical protein
MRALAEGMGHIDNPHLATWLAYRALLAEVSRAPSD